MRPRTAAPSLSSVPFRRRKQMQKTYTLGLRTFVLDHAKAEAALAAKRVVGGRETMTFNLSRSATAGPTSSTGR